MKDKEGRVNEKGRWKVESGGDIEAWSHKVIVHQTAMPVISL